jgi:hypothetical protein
MKINTIFNEKFEVSSLNKILSMLNAKPLKIKAKTITIKELLLIIVQLHRQQFIKMKKNKGGDPDSCYFSSYPMNNPSTDYLNTSTLKFATNFPPPPMTYYRDFF